MRVRARRAGRSAQDHKRLPSAGHKLPLRGGRRSVALRAIREQALARQNRGWGREAKLAASMATPISIPSRRPSATDHYAVYVAAARRDAPCSGSIATATPIAATRHCGAFDKNMPMRANPCWRAHKLHQRIPSSLCAGVRARMTGRAHSVHLPRGNACKPDARPFFAPDRPVTVPNLGWRADECVTLRDGRQEHEKRGEHLPALAGGDRGAQADLLVIEGARHDSGAPFLLRAILTTPLPRRRD